MGKVPESTVSISVSIVLYSDGGFFTVYHIICENALFLTCERYLFLLESSTSPESHRLSHPMAPPLVFDFLGIVFAAILYGKLSNNIRFR